MRIISGPSALICSLFAAILLAGCALKVEGMIANRLPTNSIAHQAVIVSVSGGNHATLLNTNLVSDETFSAALVQSLRKTGMFQSVQATGNASYKLDALLTQIIDHPSVTFGLKVDWKLTRAPDHIVWSGQTKAFFRGQARPTFVDLEHLRIATEEAVRENIEQALANLAALNF